MVEESNRPSVAAPTPPTHGVSQFSVVLNANEILISAGHSRIAMRQETGQVKPTLLVEWILTLAISPTAALVLMKSLQTAIENYENTFGKIPQDPKVKILTGESEKAPSI